MRTAIFVYEPTTLTITTTEAGLELVPFEGNALASQPRARTALSESNSIEVQPGIYKIVSTERVTVLSQGDWQIEVMTSVSKTPFPTPKPSLLSSFANVPDTMIQSFFEIPDARAFKNP